MAPRRTLKVLFLNPLTLRLSFESEMTDDELHWLWVWEGEDIMMVQYYVKTNSWGWLSNGLAKVGIGWMVAYIYKHK